MQPAAHARYPGRPAHAAHPPGQQRRVADVHSLLMRHADHSAGARQQHARAGGHLPDNPGVRTVGPVQARRAGLDDRVGGLQGCQHGWHMVLGARPTLDRRRTRKRRSTLVRMRMPHAQGPLPDHMHVMPACMSAIRCCLVPRACGACKRHAPTQYSTACACQRHAHLVPIKVEPQRAHGAAAGVGKADDAGLLAVHRAQAHQTRGRKRALGCVRQVPHGLQGAGAWAWWAWACGHSLGSADLCLARLARQHGSNHRWRQGCAMADLVLHAPHPGSPFTCIGLHLHGATYLLSLVDAPLPVA